MIDKEKMCKLLDDFMEEATEQVLNAKTNEEKQYIQTVRYITSVFMIYVKTGTLPHPQQVIEMGEGF